MHFVSVLVKPEPKGSFRVLPYVEPSGGVLYVAAYAGPLGCMDPGCVPALLSLPCDVNT